MKPSRKSCFFCQFSEVDMGSPGSRDEPPVGPEFICLDPLAAQMEEEFSEIVSEINIATTNAIFQRTDLLHNCKPGEEPMRLPHWLKQHMCYEMKNYGDFGPYCPMFHPLWKICRKCGVLFHISDSDELENGALCPACISYEIAEELG